MPPELARMASATAPAIAAAPALRLHATCVAQGGRGILLRGPPGSGKSDLALRLIDRGAVLVADDQVLIKRRGRALLARAPAGLHGLIEVRGIGILRVVAVEARLDLVIDLGEPPADRLPEPASSDLLGLPLRTIRLDPRVPSAAAMVRLALDAERFA